MPLNIRTTGRIAAGLVLTLVLVLIVVAVRNQRAAPTPPGPDPDADAPAPPPGGAGAGVGPGGVVAGSGKGSWTRVNKTTQLVEFRLEYARLTPQPGGRAEIERPEAWFYTAGKPRVCVSAPVGRVLWPSKDEPPEAGDLTGGVVVRGFEPRDGSPELPPLDTAAYKVSIDSVHFEGALSQLESTDPLLVEGPGLRAEGTGMTLRFSPVGRKLQYFSTLGRRVRIDPGAGALGKGGAGPKAAASAEMPKAHGTDTTPVTDAALDAYRVSLAGAVTLAQGPLRMNAESVDVWAKLRDGQLPAGAIAGFDPVGPGGAAREPAPGAGGKSESAVATKQPIEVAWSGMLEVRRLESAPEELKSDLLALRLSAPRNGVVTVADTEHAADLAAVRVDYAATTRRLALRGDESRAVTASVKDRFSISAPSIDADLTTGVGAINGAGRVTAQLQGGKSASSFAWKGRGDFVMDTSGGPVGAGGVIVPQRIALAEGFTGSAPEGEASASFASVRFGRAFTGRDGKQHALPSQIELQGEARAELIDAGAGRAAKAGGTIRAERLMFGFAPEPDDKDRAVLRSVSGRGLASAEQGDRRIRADSIDAVVGVDPSARKAEVTRFVAEGEVRFSGEKGVSARCDRLTSDSLRTPAGALKRTADLVGGSTGSPATIERVVAGTEKKPAQRSWISAEMLSLDEAANSITAPCPGELWTETPDAPGGPERFRARWMRQMTYHDEPGIAELVGAVTAAGENRATDRFSAKAERALVRVTPLSEGGPKDAERQLVDVTLFKSDEADTGPVVVQWKRFVAGQDGSAMASGKAELEGLADLRTARVTANPLKRSMSVPGPGRLIVEDRRSLPEGKPPDGAEESRGTTVLEWRGGVETEEATGTLKITGGVRVRHLAPDSTDATVIESETLSADIHWPEDGATDRQPRLRRLTASGGVGVIHKQLKFEGDSVAYDSGGSEIIVRGLPDRPVRVLDSATGTTATALEVALDPKTGLWRNTGAGTITVPVQRP